MQVQRIIHIFYSIDTVEDSREIPRAQATFHSIFLLLSQYIYSVIVFGKIYFTELYSEKFILTKDVQDGVGSEWLGQGRVGGAGGGEEELCARKLVNILDHILT